MIQQAEDDWIKALAVSVITKDALMAHARWQRLVQATELARLHAAELTAKVPKREIHIFRQVQSAIDHPIS